MGGGAVSNLATRFTRLASRIVISSLTAAPGTPALMASISLRISRSVFSRSRTKRWRHPSCSASIQDLGFELIAPHRQEIVTRAAAHRSSTDAIAAFHAYGSASAGGPRGSKGEV